MPGPPNRQADQVAPSAVLTKAVLRAAAQFDVPAKTLASVLGLSEATISRMRHANFQLAAGTKPFKIGVLFVRLIRSLDAIVGGDETVARSWLQNPNLTLDGRPIDKISTIAGLIDVIAYLDAHREMA